MRNRLLIFGSFAHDSQGILAAITRIAFVGIECGLNFLLRIGLELGVATLADTKEGRDLVHHSQLSFWHEASLTQCREGA